MLNERIVKINENKNKNDGYQKIGQRNNEINSKDTKKNTKSNSGLLKNNLYINNGNNKKIK